MATFEATVLGLAAPLLASWAPMMRALRPTIRDALDTTRSKVQGVIITINRNKDATLPAGMMFCGFFLALFGFMIYYLMPLALLSGSLTMLLDIFFGLLLAMLLGLVVLALNCSQLVEQLLLLVLFRWWENRAVCALVRKNLCAHRERNKHAAVMFSLATAFVVFLAVVASVQIQALEYTHQRNVGADMTIKARDPTFFMKHSKAIEEALDEPDVKDIVPGYTWVTADLRSTAGCNTVQLSNLGGLLVAQKIRIYGVAPNYLDVALPGYLEISEGYSTSGGLDIFQQLYTPEGSAGVVMATASQKKLSTKLDDVLRMSLQYDYNDGRKTTENLLLRPIAFVDAVPGFAEMSNSLDPRKPQVALISHHALMRFSGAQGNGIASMADVPLETLMMKFKPSVTKQEKLLVKARLESAVGSNLNRIGRVREVDDRQENFDLARQIMDYLFGVTMGMAFFICVFSLIAAMYANVHDQRKEIAVLRALGTGKLFVYRVYVYEAILLVLASAFLGMAIGSLVGYAMSAQRSLFLSLPTDFNFPYLAALVVVILAVVFGTLSTYGPLRRLLRLPVYTIMRSSE